MKRKISGISVVVNLVLAIGKLIAGAFANSASVMAEGIHSGMDVLSSGISFLGIIFAGKPRDKKHPYGHYKFEVLSGLIITIFLFGTGIWVLYEAYKGFVDPKITTFSYLAVGVMLLSALLNAIVARFKIHYGKKENSLSLLSDGVHDTVDVYTSVAVLLGLFIMPYWPYIDSILALLIGLYILKESFSLGKEATDSLLDVSADEKTEQKIKRIVEEGEVKVSDMKTQKKGSAVTANIEIELPSEISVAEATKTTNSIRSKLIEKVEPLEYVAIQIKGREGSSSYFEPKGTVSRFVKRGFGWQGKGRFRQKIEGAKGMGPEGYCVCPKCGYKQEHERGRPCTTIECPKCKTKLQRGE